MTRYVGIQVKTLSRRVAVPLGHNPSKIAGDYWVILCFTKQQRPPHNGRVHGLRSVAYGFSAVVSAARITKIAISTLRLVYRCPKRKDSPIGFSPKTLGEMLLGERCLGESTYNCSMRGPITCGSMCAKAACSSFDEVTAIVARGWSEPEGISLTPAKRSPRRAGRGK